MRNENQQPSLGAVAWLTKSKQLLASFPFLSVLSARKLGRSPRPIQTPTVLQMEAVECGAAALAILLTHYGRIVPLAQLRQECGVSRDGSTAANLLKVAKRYGLTAKGFKKGLNALQEVRCPYIVFWNFNHFLVVEGWRGDRVYLNDPAVGRRTVSLQEFNESYTGVVLVMEPSADFRRGGRKSSLWFALSQKLQDSTGAITYCILAGFLLVIPTLATTAFIQVFIDRILVQGQQDWLQPLLIGIVLTTLLRGFLTHLQLRYLRRLKVKLSVSMSSQFLWHILRLPTSFYAQRYAGEIAYRTGLNDKVADVLSGRLATTVIDVVMIVFYAIVMTQYDPGLTLLGVGLVAANLIALQRVSRQRVDANLRLGLEYGKVAGVVIAGLQTIETLKSSALESDFFSRWSGYYTKAINTHQELGIQNQHLSILTALLSVLASLLLLIFGGLRVMEGSLSVGMLVALQSLMQSFLEPVNRLVDLGSTLQELEGDLSRLEDVLENPVEEIADSRKATEPKLHTELQQIAVHDSSSNQPAATKFSSSRLQGQVQLRNVTFGYNPVDAPLIRDLSLAVEPGQRIALIGGSGSGKSTIAKLIGGLYQPWSGEILFDGIPLTQVPRSCLTRSRAVIEQDIFLFAGSVRQNLTLWDETVPDRFLIQACQDAAIHDVVMALPGGYDAELMEGGVNLSGGQRQLLEIARALVNNPSVLVLDEATSALDAETERVIDQNLRRRGCTCIIVAHRLSTIRDCDEILVFEQGKVVQRGTHEELCQQAGTYLHLIQTDLES